jgi:hypothetical protein
MQSSSHQRQLWGIRVEGWPVLAGSEGLRQVRPHHKSGLSFTACVSGLQPVSVVLIKNCCKKTVKTDAWNFRKIDAE